MLKMGQFGAECDNRRRNLWVSSKIEKSRISSKFKLLAIYGYYLDRFRFSWSGSVSFLFFCIFWVVWKFGREAPGLMRWDSVWCKDSSGPAGFDSHDLHFFTPPEIGAWKRESWIGEPETGAWKRESWVGKPDTVWLAGWLSQNCVHTPYILPLLCKLKSAGCLLRWGGDSLLSMREIMECTGWILILW